MRKPPPVTRQPFSHAHLTVDVPLFGKAGITDLVFLPPRFAEGGPVFGPGSADDDRIPPILTGCLYG